MNIINLELQSILQTYSRLPIAIESASGNIIKDANGTEYTDFIAGIAVNVLGHSHPKVINAAITQINRYMHVSNYFYQGTQIEFAAALKQITGYDKVFFANSGAEANEGAIKLCRFWGFEQNKTNIIAFNGGFHGRTYGALSLMNKPKYKDKMGPWLGNINIIDYNDTNVLIKTVNNKTAAIVLEFIQGEGGIITANKDFIDTIFRLREQYNFLIVADEVQTGMGRTGKFCAFEHWCNDNDNNKKQNSKPDIITLAKGIGGGLPLAAILVQEHLANIWSKGNHGTTFGGNPVACAAGMAVLNELNNGVIENASFIGDYFYNELSKLQIQFPDKIVEIRGKGLIIGIQLDIYAPSIVDSLFTEKYIISNSITGNVLRLLPPLNITTKDVDLFVSALSDLLLKYKI